MIETLVEPTPQSLVKPKIIVCKTLVDPTMVKLIADKLKGGVFTRFGFFKLPSWQIQQKFIEKDYYVYVVVEGKYAVDYYRKRSYTFSVYKKVQEVMLLNQTLKPETTSDPNKKSITLEVQERIVRESEARIILDTKGHEVSATRIPSAPSEEHPEEVLNEFQKVKPLENPPNNEIELLRLKIVKRPSEIERVVQETFEITDHAVIYAPVYKVRLQNMRTGEEKTIKIDGVTCKLTS